MTKAAIIFLFLTLSICGHAQQVIGYIYPLDLPNISTYKEWITYSPPKPDVPAIDSLIVGENWEEKQKLLTPGTYLLEKTASLLSATTYSWKGVHTPKTTPVNPPN